MAIDIKLEANGVDAVKIGSNTVTQIYLNGVALMEGSITIISATVATTGTTIAVNLSDFLPLNAVPDVDNWEFTQDGVTIPAISGVGLDTQYVFTFEDGAIYADTEVLVTLLVAENDVAPVQDFPATNNSTVPAPGFSPKYEMTEVLLSYDGYSFVDDSNNPFIDYNGKLTESDGTTPYVPTTGVGGEYPENGTLVLDNGRLMDTQYIMTDQDAVYGIYGADGSTVYNIYALEPVSEGIVNIWEGDQDTPLVQTHSDVAMALPTESWTITDAKPDFIPDVDTTKPVITMLGTSPVDVENGAVYADAGATALDDVDGDITANIVTGGLPIDTDTEGTYSVTYDVDDSSGNSADRVTRTVNVAAASITYRPVYLSMRTSAESIPEPDGIEINNINSRTSTDVWPLVDIDNVASTITYKTNIIFEGGGSGVPTGDDSSCVSDFELERNWLNNTASTAQCQVTLPAGNFTITLSANSSVTTDNRVGDYTIDGVTKQIDARASEPDCESWSVTSTGETFVIDVVRAAGNSIVALNSIRITEV